MLESTPFRVGEWACEKRFANALGRQMAYVERGRGQPIVFLHGNPTSSFLWRNVLANVEGPGRRLGAPDLIRMGDHDQLPQSADPARCRFASHSRYIDSFMNKVVGEEP